MKRVFAIAVVSMVLAGFLPVRAQAAAFTAIRALTNSEVRLQISSTSRFRVDLSTNLTSWTPLVSAERQSTGYLDAGAPFFTKRFYSVQEFPTNTITGDHFATEDGEVIVHPVFHASFVMQWKDLIIYNDPDQPNSLYATQPKANLILVSHSHGDHFDTVAINYVRTANTLLVVPADVYGQLSATLRATAIVLTNGMSTNVLGMQIEAVPAYNSNHPRGTGNGYVVTIGGKRFYMSGDTGDIPEMRALQNIDVAFLCMNVPFTMNITAGASAAREFRPRVLYPYHYKNQDGSYADLNQLKRLIGTEAGIEVRQRAWY
jgi:L-ascorbate metabolism protein UlaG (beta-lactamase superfamily)